MTSPQPSAAPPAEPPGPESAPPEVGVRGVTAPNDRARCSGPEAFRCLTVRELRLASSEFFGHFALPVRPCAAAETLGDKAVLAAAIGFTGRQARGSLALTLPKALALETAPLEALEELVLSDWVGEMANQLLGRLKNRLIPHGVDIRLSTPTIVEGRQVRILALRGTSICEALMCGGHPVFICLHTVVVPSIDLRACEEVAQSEGEAVLF